MKTYAGSCGLTRPQAICVTGRMSLLSIQGQSWPRCQQSNIPHLRQLGKAGVGSFLAPQWSFLQII